MRAEVVKGDKVTLGEIENVDVVADGGTVLGCVVWCCCVSCMPTCKCSTVLTVSEDEQLLPLANSNLSQQWKKVVRHTLRVLAHDTTRVAACRVEVSQKCSVELLAALASLLGLDSLAVDKVGDHRLHSELGVSVWVCGSQWALLWNGDHVGEAGRVSVDCCTAGEDNVGDLVLLHAPQQAECAVNVHVVIVQRLLSRLSHSLECCEVDDIVNVWVCSEDLVQLFLICDVALDIFGTLAADQLDAVEDLVGGVVKVVDDDDLVVCLKEGESGERANVAGSTGQEGKVSKYVRRGSLPIQQEACYSMLVLVLSAWLPHGTHPVTRTEPTTILLDEFGSFWWY